ncbi:MAG: hypothetical protein JW719_13085, partial [Pirellulales bacterium]|nr:hypothetical protein [Pirellulales bacterium]
MPSHKRWTNLFASWFTMSGCWQNAGGLRLIVLAAAAVSWAVAPVEAASRPAPEPVKIVRELLVPMEDLNVLLENQPRRVLLSREEYETLLEKAHTQGEAKPPRAAVLTDSDYSARLSDGRALIEGTLRVDVLADGMCAVPLDLSRVGLKEATLDGQPAAIGRDKDGRLMLLVEGRGQHELRLSLTAPIETTAATQNFSFRLPTAPSARFHMAIDGDVEVKGGLDVVSRRFDSSAGVTRFELLPRDGDVSLVMTLNSHLRRKDQIVIARTVLLAALAEAGEQFHATTSFSILHRAVDRFCFVVPEGVEITNVDSPHLSSWAVVERDGRRVLEAKLREATTDKVVLSIAAVRAAPRLDDWSLPRLTPLDADGEVTVVGLLVDKRLKPKTLDSKGLIPIDAADLRAALPPSMRDEPALVPVAAYYAPGGDYALGASFEKPPARFTATTVLLLTLCDRQQRLTANVLLAPEHEPLFEVDLRLPAAWHVDQVTDAQGRPMTFERHDKTNRLHVRLGRGIPSGGEGLIRFTATATPDTWLGDWKTTEVAFPDVDLPAGQRRRGAIAVIVQDDLEAHPEDQTGLIPLDDADKKDYQLAGVKTDLAYRHEDCPWKATLRIERTTPRLTARTYSFLGVAPGTLTAHYEIVYDATEARARTLRFRLPSTTPGDLAIRGLGGAALKEYSSTTTERGREWIVPLVEPRRGTIALAVDFQQPLGDRDPRDLALPIVAAEGVAHQSGLVAVEGNAELDVRVTTDARPVDVGELVDAEYQPGRRLL